MVHLASYLLLVLSTMAHASAGNNNSDDIWDPTTELPKEDEPFCECYNPYSGRLAYKGLPEILCDASINPGFCYVECNGACRDQSPAGYNRCQSTLACSALNGLVLNKPCE